MSSYQRISNELIEFYRRPVATVSLEISLTIVLILILIVAVVKPTLTTMSELSKEIKDKEELLIDLEKKSTALATAQAVYMSALPKLNILDQAIPTQNNLIIDLKTLEKMVSDNSMIVNTLSLSKLSSDAGVIQTANGNDKNEEQSNLIFSMPIALSVGGDYLSVRDFVDDLITYRRLFVVNSITFSIDKKRESNTLSAQLNIEAPYKIENNNGI